MNQSWIDDALHEMEGFCMPHRNFERSFAEAHAALLVSSPGEVVCITGPSRAGKSRLTKLLVDTLGGGNKPDENGSMPVVTLETVNCSTGGSFSSKAFTLRALETVQHAFYGVGQNKDIHTSNRYGGIERTSEGVLRLAFEKALIYRNTKYLVIDEALHIRHSRGGLRDAAAILDSWKCLAGQTKVVLVLVGAYPLINVLELCPHLLGRKYQVHFPRYYTTTDDLIVFEQILDAYSKWFRFKKGVVSLRSWNQFLYEESFGCLGLLVGLLRRALGAAKSEAHEYVTESHLLKARMTQRDKAAIALEIKNGEEALGIDVEAMRTVRPDAKIRKKKRLKPFQQKPRRFRVNGRA